MKINPEQTNGEQSLKGLIELTKNKGFKENPIIKKLEEQGVFK